jgi:3-oxoacyl-[acyl-carrier protein] reductase
MMLKDKIAVVTGAGRGIGQAIAIRLAHEGAKVACVSRTATNAEKSAAAINGNFPGAARAYAADVADHASVQAMAAQVLRDFERCDILVNNAGVTRDGLSMRMTGEDWDVVLDTNLKGAFQCMQAFQRAMLRQRAGRIINISSVIGLIGNAGQANYAASKAGLFGLTKSMARELASRGITVNAIAPGFITTEMTAGLPEETKTAILGQVPLARFGTGEEIAGAVAFLAGPDAAYITGQTLTVDGGMVMS